MKKTLPIIFAGLFLLSAPSYADWMQGTIKSIEGKSLTINRTDAAEGDSKPSELKVKILDDAKLKNISAVEDLQSGQEIKVDARENKEQGFWDVKYLEVIGTAGQTEHP